MTSPPILLTATFFLSTFTRADRVRAAGQVEAGQDRGETQVTPGGAILSSTSTNTDFLSQDISSRNE